MPKLQFESQQIKDVINSVVKRTFEMDFTWDWAAGVAFYGVCRAHHATGNDDYLKQLIDWVDEKLEDGMPKLTVNGVSVGHTVLYLYQQTSEQRYLDIAVKLAEYLKNEAPRFAEGIFQHTVSQNYNFPEQAWVDTMFMAGYFLIRMGQLLDRTDFMEDGVLQYHGHENYLQDQATNLYYHGWDHIAQNHMSGVFWARGNAWASYTMAQALNIVPVSHPSFMKIHDSLRDQLSSLVRLQSENGLWHTVLQESESYEELSGSAGIAAALIGFNQVLGNPLYNKHIQQSIEGILEHITEDGMVQEVSAGTAVMDDLQGYYNTPCKRIQGWGQGLTLAFLAAVLEYE